MTSVTTGVISKISRPDFVWTVQVHSGNHVSVVGLAIGAETIKLHQVEDLKWEFLNPPKVVFTLRSRCPALHDRL